VAGLHSMQADVLVVSMVSAARVQRADGPKGMRSFGPMGGGATSGKYMKYVRLLGGAVVLIL